MIIKRCDNAGLHELRLRSSAVARYAFIVVLDFVALHRESCVVAAIVSGHVVVLDSEDVEGETKAQVFVALEAQASGPETLGLHDIRRLLNTRRNIGADVAHRETLNRADEGELQQIHPQRWSSHLVMVIGAGKYPMVWPSGFATSPR